MPCMCGDTNCPSCGPAQGHDPDMKRLYEVMTDLAKPDGDEEQEGCDKLVRALCQFPRIADLLHVVIQGMVLKKNIKDINKWLDDVRPCKIHDEWPDPELGCISCYNDSFKDD